MAKIRDLGDFSVLLECCNILENRILARLHSDCQRSDLPQLISIFSTVVGCRRQCVQMDRLSDQLHPIPDPDWEKDFDEDAFLAQAEKDAAANAADRENDPDDDDGAVGMEFDI